MEGYLLLVSETLQTNVLVDHARVAMRILGEDSDSMSSATALFFELYFKLDYSSRGRLLEATSRARYNCEGIIYGAEPAYSRGPRGVHDRRRIHRHQDAPG